MSSFCTHYDMAQAGTNGFVFNLEGGHPCINLWKNNGRLNSPTKFALAMISLFLMTLFLESLSKIRTSAVMLSSGGKWSFCLRVFVCTLFAMQAFGGYLLMLAAMTYSAELFLTIVMGHFVGKMIFWEAPLAYPAPAPPTTSGLTKCIDYAGHAGGYYDRDGVPVPVDVWTTKDMCMMGCFRSRDGSRTERSDSDDSSEESEGMI